MIKNIFYNLLLLILLGCAPAQQSRSYQQQNQNFENIPQDYYKVQKGDTLAKIALANGQSPSDVAQWNAAVNPSFKPNGIEVGDLILIKAPRGVRVDSSKEVNYPGIRLSWPAKGSVAQLYSESNKGIDIAGKLGDPITAAANGKVVYAGNTLRGYGNLIIIKHDNTYLTAYAHNKTLLVKEGDSVVGGQKISEMGDTDANSVKLHFEVRVNGKPVDPEPFLSTQTITNQGVTNQPATNIGNSQSLAAQPEIPLAPPVSFIQGRRLALVIGNAAYQSRPLNNPRNDADDVSKTLKGAGFEVIDLRDSTLAQMRLATRQFGERLMSNDVGLVYYSGHGIEVKGKNYFIPVNADIKSSDEVADQALDVSLILAKMDSAKKGVNILIVDACRDDPFGRSYRSNSRGLAAMDAPQGTIIAYATSPGNIAADGSGRNSPYTRNLVKAMQTPNLPVELMFKEVRRAVREETRNQQTPWENTSLSGNFYFKVQK